MWILKQKTKAKSHGTINQKVKAKTGLCTLLHVACGTTGFLLFVTILSGIVLSSTTIHAANPAQSNVTVNVNTACTASGGGTYSAKAVPGNTVTIAGSTFSTVCNDSEGYSIYAIGYGDESYDTPTNTQMIGEGGIGNIVTGTAKSGNTSNWAMQVTPTSGSAPTITNGFDSADFHVVPETYTQVAKYTSTTASPTATGARIDAKYQAYVISTQAIGTYTGKVKYTMVHPNTAPAPELPGYMQDATLADCGKTMYDSRDTGRKTEYTTALIGGQCWMTTNLNLAGGTALSADDTDITSAYISSFTTSNNLTKSGNTIVLPASSTSGFDTDNYSYVYNSGKTPASDSDCGTPGCYSYYSWDTATVGSGRSITANNTDAPYSICPKGWHLPNTRSGTNDTADFRKLMTLLGGSADIQTYTADTTPTGATIFSGLSSDPLNYLRAGFYYGSTFYYGGGDGRYWSATSNSGTSARNLYFDSTSVYSADSLGRRDGFSVRCVMNTPTMQSATAESLAAAMPNVGDSTTLRDERDDKEYTVAKLADGKYWMTQNLDHDIKTDGSVAYTPATTDVPAAWTPSTATYPTGTTTWNASTTAPESYDPGALYWSGTPGDSTPVSTGDSHYHLGNYYNWTAAVAMNDSSSYTTDQQDVNQSICPANWTLPKGGNVTTSGSFQYLVTQYGWDSSSYSMDNPYIWDSPIKTSLSGRWRGSRSLFGGVGYFWSSMVSGSNASYYLYASSDGYLSPDGDYNRGNGVSVRCLARW